MTPRIICVGLWGMGFCAFSMAQALTPVQALIPDSAQSAPKVEVYKKSEVYHREINKNPAPYNTIREADVLFEKTVWRMIDMEQKPNQALYYPTVQMGRFKNLIHTIMDAVEQDSLTVYSPLGFGNEFNVPLTKQQALEAMGAGTVTEKVYDINETRDTVLYKTPQYEQIQRLLIKEIYLFNKASSRMEVRVVGFCPIRVIPRDVYDEEMATTTGETESALRETFWVFMPEARNLLAGQSVMNRQNDAASLSYDDYFLQRRYNGLIYAISNMYNNRPISEYFNGKEALYEAQRLEEALYNWEQDLWEN